MMAAALMCSVVIGVGWTATVDVAAQESKASTTAAAPLNLNAASVSDLETLPGVGPAIASRIVEYRQKNGGFKKIEDLMNVRGIGERSFLQLKPLVTVVAPKGA
jgi:competence protein ComEA